MKCPHCEINLLMSERQGVEIDYCPECRGVWLDRGELDKIVERSHNELVAVPAPPSPSAQSDDRYRDDRDRPRDDDRSREDDDRDRGGDRYRSGGTPKKKRKSFLEDIFEF